MTFRKDYLLLKQERICFICMIVMCLFFIPTYGIEISLVLELTFTILLLATPKLHNEHITIDEMGITCHTPKSQIWSYKWEDIAELKRSSRFRLPSMEVIPKNSRLHAPSNHYFQLSKKAKDALKKYKPTEIST